MKKIIIAAVLSVFTTAVVSCSKTDIVAIKSVESFSEIIKSSEVNYNQSNDSPGWVLRTAGGEKVTWNPSTSKNNRSLILEFDAAPFIAAGLAVDKLPSDIFSYNADTNRISVFPVSFQNYESSENNKSALDAFSEIVKQQRATVGYHKQFDHYGFDLGAGNMFEWASDLKTNDKDIVFVLNPEHLISAGVVAEKIEGWIYAEITMMNKQGVFIKEYKILKPYNLK